MQRVNIISCGPSGANWDGKGDSIGVNDCEKFGKKVQALVVVNSRFEPERERIILNTIAPYGFYSQLLYWHGHPNFKHLPKMTAYTSRRKIDLHTLYSARTSPFVAISLAAMVGYTEIVLHGVDFEKHPIVKDHVLKNEIFLYEHYAKSLEMLGVKVYLSSDYGELKGFLPCLPQ